MAEMRWTEEAHRWLRDIHEYIAADNPRAAREALCRTTSQDAPGATITGPEWVLAVLKTTGNVLCDRLLIGYKYLRYKPPSS